MGRFLTSWKFTYPVALLMIVGMVAIRAWDPLPLQIARNKTFDAFQQIKPRVPPEDGYPIGVRIIDIDDESLNELGQWPWPRTLIADLVRKLVDDYGVAAVAFDVVFAEPDRQSPAIIAERLADELSPEAIAALEALPDNDLVFAETIEGRHVVLGQATIPRGEPPAAGDVPRKRGLAEKNTTPHPLPPVRVYLKNFPNIERNLAVLEEAAAGIGLFSFEPDEDNIVRKVPLVIAVNGELYPALRVEALRVVIERLKGGEQQSMLLRYDVHGPNTLFIGPDFSLPTDEDGQTWVYYAPYTRDRYVSVRDVLAGTVPPELLAGHIVILGTSAAGLQDIRATPLSDALPGVEVHAQLLENLVSGVHLTRWTYAKWIEPAIILVSGFLVMLIMPFGGALWSLFAIVLIDAAVVGGSWYMFAYRQQLVGFLYPLVCSILLYTFLTFMNYVREEQAKKQVRGAFAQYLSPAMVEELASNPDRLKLGGEMRNMTLLFSDIRGFTAISEQFRGNPVGLVSLINRFLTPMTGIILDRKGTIDKYMGDCIMAFWNAPLLDEEQVANSIDAALTMTDEVDRLNVVIEAEAKAEGRRFFPIKVGVGINTGEVFVGNMGSDQRFDYSVIGDDVNLASRLEGQSKTYGVIIVIGPNTQAAAADRFATLELDRIQVKGRSEAVTIFTVLGRKDTLDDPAYRSLHETNEAMLAAYRSQDWDRAEALLAESRALWPALHGFFDLYAERIAEFRVNPPPADWDGVYVATSK